jgi:hypothetical protein
MCPALRAVGAPWWGFARRVMRLLAFALSYCLVYRRPLLRWGFGACVFAVVVLSPPAPAPPAPPSWPAFLFGFSLTPVPRRRAACFASPTARFAVGGLPPPPPPPRHLPFPYPHTPPNFFTPPLLTTFTPFHQIQLSNNFFLYYLHEQSHTYFFLVSFKFSSICLLTFQNFFCILSPPTNEGDRILPIL